MYQSALHSGARMRHRFCSKCDEGWGLIHATRVYCHTLYLALYCHTLSWPVLPHAILVHIVISHSLKVYPRIHIVTHVLSLLFRFCEQPSNLKMHSSFRLGSLNLFSKFKHYVLLEHFFAALHQFLCYSSVALYMFFKDFLYLMPFH